MYSQGSEYYAEAINVHGYSNTITVQDGGIVRADRAAAIWFQDQVPFQAGVDQKNEVDNYGTIQGPSTTASVFGSQGSQQGGIVFRNQTGGQVVGSLYFGNGNDELFFYSQSNVTGNIDGGAGTNSLTLDGADTTRGDVLRGDIRNFSTLAKDGTGVWTITGSIQGFTAVDVNEGLLVLTGNNSGFSGKLTVHNGGSLEAAARSLPTNSPTTGNTQNVEVEAGGVIELVQDYDDSYAGQIYGGGSMTKSGTGTVTLAPDAGANLYTGARSLKRAASPCTTAQRWEPES